MKKEHSIEFRISDKRESPLHFQANKKHDGIHGCWNKNQVALRKIRVFQGNAKMTSMSFHIFLGAYLESRVQMDQTLSNVISHHLIDSRGPTASGDVQQNP